MSDRGGALVFLVDDDLQLLEAVAELLELEGFRVTPFHDPAEALQAAAQETPDLVLLDVAMPRISGPALAREIQKIHPRARTLFMSGFAVEAAVTEHGLAADAPFLPKPFTRAALAKAVRGALTSLD